VCPVTGMLARATIAAHDERPLRLEAESMSVRSSLCITMRRPQGPAPRAARGVSPPLTRLVREAQYEADIVGGQDAIECLIALDQHPDALGGALDCIGMCG
jgi:hypothetical protein